MRETEEDVVYNFTNFLDYVQKAPVKLEAFDYENILAMYEEAAKCANDGGLKRVQVALEDVLQFLTHSKFITTLKGVKGETSFTHDVDAGRRVKVDTCGSSIIFPATGRYTASDSFLKNFEEDIFNSPGFWVVEMICDWWQ